MYLINSYKEAYYSTTYEIANCYAHGDVTGNYSVGGLVGRQYWIYGNPAVTNCYSTGLVTGNSNTGGLVGQNSGSVTNSYYNSETSGKTDTSKGTPLTGEEMKSADNYLGWDFENTWAISSDIYGGYPNLKAVKGFKVSADLSGTEGTVYAVMYDNKNNMTALRQYSAEEFENAVFNVDDTGAYVKLMHWNQMTPMCEPKTSPMY